MNTFYLSQKKHQKDWRKTNIHSLDWGYQNGDRYEHIVPKSNWKETLWIGIRKELPEYLKLKNIQAHTGTHNLLSSWVLCANLYFPVRNNAELKRVMVDFLNQKVSDQITGIIDVDLEFAFPENDNLHPAILLGELDGNRGSGQTSPDVAFIVQTKDGNGIILTECKFTEHSFYPCSARRNEDNTKRIGNPDRERCMVPADRIIYETICHQTIWGRKYWSLLRLSEIGENILKRCPAATAGYQLFRQHALAEGIAQSGRFTLVSSTVAFDERNIDLKNCLKRTGINDFQTGWAPLFEGKSIFKTWTHQEWVTFVRDNQEKGEFDSWLEYLNERYGY